MNPARLAEAELLEATARRLTEEGYEVVLEPPQTLVPHSLKGLRPDAVAIGRSPKLVVEIAAEGEESARRVAALQRALRDADDWKLHLVLDRASVPSPLPTIAIDEIRSTLGRAEAVALVDTRSALLLCWACTEALSRALEPGYFARPQSPARIVEHLATEAKIAPSDAKFLRTMAQLRNSFVHGDLSQLVTKSQIQRFIALLSGLIEQADRQPQPG
jgi:hypothetical protein